MSSSQPGLNPVNSLSNNIPNNSTSLSTVQNTSSSTNVQNTSSSTNVQNTSDANVQKKKRCSGFCWPTIIYIILASTSFVLWFFVGGIGTLFSMLFQLLITGLFTLLLYMLCRHCHNRWAWFFLLLPFILIGLMLFLAIILGILTIL